MPMQNTVLCMKSASSSHLRDVSLSAFNRIHEGTTTQIIFDTQDAIQVLINMVSFASITCAIQLWCLKKHDSFLLFPLTRFLLSLLYYIDLAIYSSNPRAFLVGRSEMLNSQNFASLGRMILADHPVVAKAIKGPQIRDSYLGRARLIANKFTDSFPLFLSDAIEEERVKHKAIHEYFWNTIIPAASTVVEKNPELFQGYVTEIVECEKDGVPDTDTLRKTIIRYIFHALLGRIDDRMVEVGHSLFFGGIGDYVGGGIKLPSGFGFVHWKNNGSRNALIEEAIKYVSECPHMADYESFQDISKEEFSEMLFSVCGIAGVLGTTQLITNIFMEIPQDFAVDVTNPREVLMCILEAARIRAPVNK